MKKVVLFLSFVLSSLMMFAQDAPELVCPTPFVAALPLDATSAGVIWNSTAAASYTLQYRACADTEWTSVNNLTAGVNPRDTGYYILHNLVSCKCYVVRLRANCSATEVSDWRSYEFRTAGCVEPCKAPSQLFAASRDSMASLNWSPSTSAERILSNGNHVRTRFGKHRMRPNNSLTINHLSPCSEYQFRVRTICSATDTSAYSESVKFKTSGCVAPCSTPREVRVVVAPDRSNALVTWTNTGARAYEVMYTAGDSAARTITVTTNALRLLSLASCKTYKFKVRSICGSATSTTPVYSEWSASVSVNTEGCVRCEAPRRLSFAVTELGAILKWDTTVGTSITYDIQWMGPRDTAWRTVTAVRGNQYSLTGLTACTWYMFRVRANCTTTSGSLWSQSVRFQTKGCAPICVAPKNLKVYVSDTVAVISWIGATTTSNYKLIVTSSDGTFTREVSVTGFSCILTGLARCKTYKIQLRTVCSNTSVSETVTTSFETRGCPVSCGTPREVNFQADSNKVTLKWANMGASKYYIEYKLSADSITTWKRDSSTTNSVMLSGFQTCKTYQFRIASVCANGVSAFSEPFKFTTLGCPVPCVRTTGLGSEITNDTVALVKFAITAGTTYTVQYRVAGTANWISIPVNTIPANALPVRITGLNKCTTYQWRVLGSCQTGVISESEVLTFTTKGCPTPCTAAPREPSLITYPTDSARLTWIAPTAGLTYEVRYGAAIDSSVFTTTPTRLIENSFVMRGLVACRYYIVQLRTVCPNGQVSDWITKQFRLGSSCFGEDEFAAQSNNDQQYVSDFGVYPNPGNEFFQVAYKLEQDANVQVELMNLQGQLVNRLNGGNQEAGNYVQTLDNLANLHNGIYLVVIRANGKVAHTQKWQKQ